MPGPSSSAKAFLIQTFDSLFLQIAFLDIWVSTEESGSLVERYLVLILRGVQLWLDVWISLLKRDSCVNQIELKILSLVDGSEYKVLAQT